MGASQDRDDALPDAGVAPVAVHLGPAGDAGLHLVLHHVERDLLPELLHKEGKLRTRSHKAHIAHQDAAIFPDAFLRGAEGVDLLIRVEAEMAHADAKPAGNVDLRHQHAAGFIFVPGQGSAAAQGAAQLLHRHRIDRDHPLRPVSIFLPDKQILRPADRNDAFQKRIRGEVLPPPRDASARMTAVIRTEGET